MIFYGCLMEIILSSSVGTEFVYFGCEVQYSGWEFLFERKRFQKHTVYNHGETI